MAVKKSLTSALVALLLSGAPLPDEIGAALEARAATATKKKPPINARLAEVDQLARGYLVLQARFREHVDEIKALRAAVKKRGGR